MTSDFISLNVQSSNHSASSKPEHGCHPVLNIAQIIKKKKEAQICPGLVHKLLLHGKKCDHIFKKQIKHWQEVGRATHILLLGHSSSLSVHVVVYNLRLVGKSRAYMYILSHRKIRIVLHTSKNTCVLGVLSDP